MALLTILNNIFATLSQTLTFFLQNHKLIFKDCEELFVKGSTIKYKGTI